MYGAREGAETRSRHTKHHRDTEGTEETIARFARSFPCRVLRVSVVNAFPRLRVSPA
jgi:hypothetical protein